MAFLTTTCLLYTSYHHMLAKRGIHWESDKHLAFTDAVFELINYAAVKADTALAREKSRYALFEGCLLYTSPNLICTE